MFEKEINFITDFSLEKIKSLGSYFTFNDILAADIHPSITKYISAELNYLIFEDREKLLASSIFDYSQPNVVKLLQSVDNELKKCKTISYADVKKLVLQAVSFNANFVARPKWSLLKLVYNKAETKSAEKVLLMLDYIYFHEYLRSIIAEYIEKKKLKVITREKFEEILTKIDAALIKDDERSYIDNSLATMLEFYGIGSKNKNKINTDYVELFLKEKEFVEPLLKLKSVYPFGTGAAAGIDEIKEILFGEDIVPASIPPVLSDEETETQVEVAEDNERQEEVLKEDDTILETPEEELPEEKIENEVEDTEEENNISPSEELKTEIEEEKIAGNKEPEKAMIENKIDEVADRLNSDIKNSNKTTEKDELSVKNELLSSVNNDELLTLFDEELKALAEDDELDSEIDLSIYDDESKYADEGLQSDTEHIEDIEKKDELETETTVEESEENIFDMPLEEIEDNLTSDFLEDDSGNFIEDIPDDLNKTEKQDIPESKENENELSDKTADEIPVKPKREKDIFQFLSDKEIEKIVSNVFNGDREDFAITLEKISECETHFEANEIMKGVFISYRVNMYTKEASTLTSAISDYFKQ